MLLSEIFDFLTYGELSNISVGNEGNGILPTSYPKLVTAINGGMIEIYKRFDLKSQEIILQLYDQITLYNLHTDFAQSNIGGAEPIKYIVDAPPAVAFNNNILLITEVYNELGSQLPLNDKDEELSVFTPTPISLQVVFPSNADENVLSIVYRARPDLIMYTGLTDPTTIEVPLPFQFLDALTSFVAYKMISPLDLADQNSDSNFYYAKFEAALDLITNIGMVNSDNNANHKLDSNGWA